MKKLFPEVLDVSPSQTWHSENPSDLQPIFDSSGVQMTSNISSPSFSCKQVCASSPLQPVFCLAERKQRKGLAQPPSTTVPNASSPPASSFHAVMAGEQELGARSSFRHLSPAGLAAVPPSQDTESGCTLVCHQCAPGRDRGRLTGE